jgi:hypothetical protein
MTYKGEACGSGGQVGQWGARRLRRTTGSRCAWVRRNVERCGFGLDHSHHVWVLLVRVESGKTQTTRGVVIGRRVRDGDCC